MNITVTTKYVCGIDLHAQTMAICIMDKNGKILVKKSIKCEMVLLMEQLKPFFPNVRLSRYEDNLHVTEVEPLIAHFRSGVRAGELSDDEFAKLESDLEKKKKKKGRIFITKDSGLFEAIK